MKKKHWNHAKKTYFGSLFLIGSLLFSLGCFSGKVRAGAQGPDSNPEDGQGARQEKNMPLGYVDVDYGISRLGDGEAMPFRLTGESETELPFRYDAREHGQVTEVKAQSPWNNCWSFATIGALESSVLSRGEAEEIDLSEYHLCYYNYLSVTDPLGGTREDSVEYQGTFSGLLNSGGNVLVAYHALTNWMGAVAQEQTGYPTTGEELAPGVEGAYLQDEIQLRQMYQISRKDVEAVKQAIMSYGAVTAAFYYQSGYLDQESSAYYNNGNTNANHGVVIVGWDDTFSRELFPTEPSEDGAWLVKNSWGTGFGKEGYLWLSYQDTSLQEAMCVLIGEAAGEYDHNYQYDGSYYNQYIRCGDHAAAANVFQVPKEAQRQILRAVSFEVGSTNAEYSIQIYRNPTDPGDPESGEPMLDNPLTGSAVFQGFHTVELTEDLPILPGESFAVVVDLYGEDAVRVTLEKSQVWNRTRYVAGAQKNQSFLRIGEGDWFDAGLRYEGNVRIKAFTSDQEEGPKPEMKFLDVKEDGWQYPYVAAVYEKGIMVGKTPEFFGVDQETLRSEFVTTLYHMSGEPPVQFQESFQDVKAGNWYTDPVLWAARAGLASGYGNGCFGVSDRITREQLVKILYEYYLKLCGGQRESRELQGFEDTEEVSDWACEAMGWAVNRGIVAGKQTREGGIRLAPGDPATRGECATILAKFIGMDMIQSHADF